MDLQQLKEAYDSVEDDVIKVFEGSAESTRVDVIK